MKLPGISLVVSSLLVAGQALAQVPAAELGPYVDALKAAGAYLPGSASKSLHLANYDDASHKALVSQAFTAGILGGGIVPAAKLVTAGSTIPTGARWTERRYVFASESQCEVFINVREVGSAMARAVPQHAAFSVWHELAHCTLLELLAASDDGGQRAAARSTAAKFGSVLPEGKGRLAYALLSEAFADGFALLVEASVRGNEAARDMAQALLRYRRQEKSANVEDTGAHDTSLALGLALSTLAAYDLSGLGVRDRYVLAMGFASEGAARWAEAEAGAGAAAALRPVLAELEKSLLAAATAAAARPAGVEIPVYLAYPGAGRQDRLRVM